MNLREEKLLYDEELGQYYKIDQNNKRIPVIDPINGGQLIPQSDRSYISETTGRKFTWDEKRQHFIPNYFQEEEGKLGFESAHIEGDYLVGDNTGKRFLIDENGVILTPREIERQEKRKRANQEISWKIERKINKLDNDNNEEYLNKVIKMSEEESKPLMHEFLFENNLCYYSIHELGPNSKEEAITAKICSADDTFKTEFLEPLLANQLKKDEVDTNMESNTIITPLQTNSNICALDIVTPKWTIIKLTGIDVNYANFLTNSIHESRQKEEHKGYARVREKKENGFVNVLAIALILTITILSGISIVYYLYH